MKIDRKALRAARAAITAENKLWPSHLVSVPRDRWPAGEVDSNPKEVWRSRTLLVQVFEERDGWVRLSICRAAIDSNGRWKDGLTWEDLQSIKSQVGFGVRDAIEIYPADQDVVNVANIRHLWVSPVPLNVAWRA